MNCSGAKDSPEPIIIFEIQVWLNNKAKYCEAAKDKLRYLQDEES